MKRSLALLALFGGLLTVGCSEPQASSVVDGTSQSEVDEYNRMLQESQAAMAEGDAAQEAYDKNPKKD